MIMSCLLVWLSLCCDLFSLGGGRDGGSVGNVGVPSIMSLLDSSLNQPNSRRICSSCRDPHDDECHGHHHHHHPPRYSSIDEEARRRRAALILAQFI